MNKLVYAFYCDLENYQRSNVQEMAVYFGLPATSSDDQRWLIALRNAQTFLKASMPSIVIKEPKKINALDVILVFITENFDSKESSDPDIQKIDRLLIENTDFIYKDENRAPKNASTRIPLTAKNPKPVQNSFRAFMIINDKLAGIANGKYMPDIFGQPISRFGMMSESEVKWIQIGTSFRGKGLCKQFMAFVIDQLHELGSTNVVVDNVGGTAGCMCYYDAGKLVGADSIGIIGQYGDWSNWVKIERSMCVEEPNLITHLFFPDDFLYKEWLK